MAGQKRKRSFRKTTSIWDEGDVDLNTNILRSEDGSENPTGTWTWKWGSDPNYFKDNLSGRPVMRVVGKPAFKGPMELVVVDGKWTLKYPVLLFVTRHRWVYKLDAYTVNHRVLFTLISPPSARTAGGYVIKQTGQWPALAGDDLESFIEPADVKYWVRRGVGEYRD